MKILVTGTPGIGKTTVVERVVAHLGDMAGGFITREIRERGSRTGFMIETLDGQKAVLATLEGKAKPRVGRYHVIVSNLENVGVVAIEHALQEGKIIVVDEIGKMELLSPRFRDTILRVLDREVSLLATIGVGKDPLLRSIRKRRDIQLMKVTKEKRNDLPMKILKLLGHGGGWSHEREKSGNCFD